jgi:hypothetical protein
MIRRGFWLALGAALGVAGYRRAGRLARALRPSMIGARLARGGSSRSRTGRAACSVTGGPGGAAAFLRDVRDGMDEYLERRQGQRGPTLEGQQPARLAGAGPDQAGPGQAAIARPRQRPGLDYAKDGS